MKYKTRQKQALLLYSKLNEEESLKTIHPSVDLGLHQQEPYFDFITNFLKNIVSITFSKKYEVFTFLH
jgi:hypothetical protein